MWFKPVLKSSNSVLIHMAALAGIGAARLPGWVVDAYVATGRLGGLNADRSLRAGLFTVYRSRRYLPPKRRSFINLLVTQLRIVRASDQAAAWGWLDRAQRRRRDTARSASASVPPWHGPA